MHATCFAFLEALQYCGQNSSHEPAEDQPAPAPEPLMKELPPRVRIENAHVAAQGALRDMGLQHEHALVAALETAYQDRIAALEGNTNSNHDAPVFI